MLCFKNAFNFKGCANVVRFCHLLIEIKVLVVAAIKALNKVYDTPDLFAYDGLIASRC